MMAQPFLIRMMMATDSSLSAALLQRLLGSSLSVAASYVYHLLPVTDALALPVDTFLQQAGFSREQLARPDQRLPLWQVLKWVQQLQALDNRPGLGIRLGQAMRPKAFPVLGYAAMSAGTLGDAIAQLLRFEQLVWDVGTAELVQRGEVSLIRQRTRLPDSLPPMLIEMSLAGWVSVGRELLQDHPRLQQEALPTEVHFRAPAPADTSVYDDFFRCPVLFGQRDNAVMFPTSLLAEPTRDADPLMQQWMQQQGERLLQNYRHELNLSNEVRAVIARQLQQGEPDPVKIAAELGMSDRQLRRKLQDNGRSLQELSDDIRRELALLYLQQPQLSLVDIAFMLGYSEQSAFNRAFKRWTGHPPGRFRTPAEPV